MIVAEGEEDDAPEESVLRRQVELAQQYDFCTLSYG